MAHRFESTHIAKVRSYDTPTQYSIPSIQSVYVCVCVCVLCVHVYTYKHLHKCDFACVYRYHVYVLWLPWILLRELPSHLQYSQPPLTHTHTHTYTHTHTHTCMVPHFNGHCKDSVGTTSMTIYIRTVEPRKYIGLLKSGHLTTFAAAAPKCHVCECSIFPEMRTPH